MNLHPLKWLRASAPLAALALLMGLLVALSASSLAQPEPEQSLIEGALQTAGSQAQVRERRPVPLKVPQALIVEGPGPNRQLVLPTGFEVGLFAARLRNPRFMAFTSSGALLVSVRSAGLVVALPDLNGDGVADLSVVFASRLQGPHGLAVSDGWVYVAENHRVVRLRDDNGDLVSDRSEVVVPSLPTGGSHTTRTLIFGPDGGLYVSAGSSCNVCAEQEPRRAAITRYDATSRTARVFASGLRNAVGLAWHPTTSEFWATDNGRDNLGDDLPPEDLNLVVEGGNYGWPYCYGDRVPDPEMGMPELCPSTLGPMAEFGAHSAPLGLNFYTGSQFPSEYSGDLFVALHGSWNRTVPQEPKLVRVRMPNGRPSLIEDFATGWQPDGTEASRWGRPVQPIEGPDGSLYLSDDHAGVIYRIVWRGPAP